MYSIVLMAALTTGTDMPDFGRRGGCHGCYGGCMGMGMGYGGCMGMGMGYGMGMGMGYGGCMGMGMGYGGCMGMGWGGGYGRYAMNSYLPLYGSYAYSPIISNWGWGNNWGWGTPLVSAAGTIANPGLSQSFYFNPTTGNEATLIVHLPEDASLSIDGEQTQQRSATRTFTSPPLESGKTYTYKLRAEINRDGHFIRDTKTVEVRAGQRTDVTMKFSDTSPSDR
jgi:uncharacterized protein (TIGR03000 family)